MASEGKALAPTFAKQAGRKLRRLVFAGLLSAWTAGWGLISIVGWAARSPIILYTGFGMVGAGLAVSAVAWGVGRRRRQARARRSLSARADMDGLALTEGMSARLHVFDDAFHQLQNALDDPGLPHADRSVEVTAELTEAQGALYRLAERSSAVRREIGQLGRHASTDLVRQTRDDKQAELTRLDREAEELVKQTRVLAATAEQVRELASARSATTTERLREAVDQFNLTLSAYREVESVSELRRRRKAQSQTS